MCVCDIKPNVPPARLSPEPEGYIACYRYHTRMHTVAAMSVTYACYQARALAIVLIFIWLAAPRIIV